MRRRALGLATGLLVLAACGAGGPGAISPGASACPTPVIDDEFEPELSPTLCPSGSANGQGGQGGQGGAGGGNAGPGGSSGPGAGGGAGGGAGAGAGGGGGNSVSKDWSETVTVSDPTLQSTRHQEYRATVNVVLGGDGEGSWTLTGTATVASAFTEELTQHLVDLTSAPCTTHHSDDSSASGSVPVEGGLDASDGYYSFYLYVGGIDGTNISVRNDSACGGPNTTETNVWSAAPTTLSGSGEYSGSSISGSTSEPREGGQDTLTWSFTLPQ